MIDPLQARLTTMAERLARIEHRTDTLEQCLPRIGQLETGVATLDHRVERVAHDLQAIGTDSHRTVEALQRLQQQHHDLNHRISQLFWTGAGAMLAIGLLVSAINLIATVQELPVSFAPKRHQDARPADPAPRERVQQPTDWLPPKRRRDDPDGDWPHPPTTEDTP